MTPQWIFSWKFIEVQSKLFRINLWMKGSKFSHPCNTSFPKKKIKKKKKKWTQDLVSPGLVNTQDPRQDLDHAKLWTKD